MSSTDQNIMNLNKFVHEYDYVTEKNAVIVKNIKGFVSNIQKTIDIQSNQITMYKNIISNLKK